MLLTVWNPGTAARVPLVRLFSVVGRDADLTIRMDGSLQLLLRGS